MNAISEGVLSGVGQTFLVAAIGLAGRLTGVIGERTIHELTRLSILLLLPCFLFEAVLREFSWSRIGGYSLMIFAAFAVLAVGLSLGWLGSRVLGLGERDRRTVMGMSAFNNSLNIPVPLALALVAASQADQLVVLFTIYNLVWSPLIWSLGVWLIASHRGNRAFWKTVITPPGVAIVVGIIAATPPLRDAMLSPRLDFAHAAIRWSGSAAIPLSLLILGAILGGMLRRVKFHWRVVGLVTVVKLIIIPAVALALLKLAPGLDALVVLALIIQAASPPATNLILIAEHYGGDTDTVGATLVATYALSILTLVLWISLAA